MNRRKEISAVARAPGDRRNTSAKRFAVDQQRNLRLCMKPEEIVLLPATHETVACFHVKEELVTDFLRHLESKGIEVSEPPQRQGNPEMPFVKVSVKEGIPEAKLQRALDDFEDNR